MGWPWSASTHRARLDGMAGLPQGARQQAKTPLCRTAPRARTPLPAAKPGLRREVMARSALTCRTRRAWPPHTGAHAQPCSRVLHYRWLNTALSPSRYRSRGNPSPQVRSRPKPASRLTVRQSASHNWAVAPLKIGRHRFSSDARRSWRKGGNGFEAAPIEPFQPCP
jgi:hypothetical protein